MPQLVESPAVISGNVNRLPTLANRLHQIIGNFRFKGARESLSHYHRRAVEILMRTETEPEVESASCDERFAAESLDAPFEQLAIQSPNAKWGLPYVPTEQHFFDKVVGSLPVPLRDYSFIDLGAGKGAALLLAAQYPFKEITGVEYSKVFADVAAENIDIYQRQGRSRESIHCHWGDAADFELPASPTILYLYNPFQGKVMDRVIANIERSLRSAPRDFWVIYGVPWEGRKFRRNSLFQTLAFNAEYSLHRSIKRG